MLTYYMSKYLLKAGESNEAATIVVDGVEEKHIREAAQVTEGFSGKLPRLVFDCCSFVRFASKRFSAVKDGDCG